MIRDAFLTCAQKVSLIYHTEPKTKNWEKEKLKSEKRYAQKYRQQSGESVESVVKKKEGCGGKDLQKRKDCQPRKLNTEDAMDRSKWRKLIKDVR